MESGLSHTSNSDITCMTLNSRALCVVCGASAIGRNFDAYTCLSCKAFFRRNAYNEYLRYACRLSGTCEISIATRRHCSTCRLNKCFEKGMKKELIRSLAAIRQATSGTITSGHHHNQESPRSTIMDSSPPNDQSFLSFDDWNLITNIRNAYEDCCVQPLLASHQTIPLTITTQPYRSRIKLKRLADLKYKYVSVIASFIKRIIQSDTSVDNHYESIKNNFQLLLTINTSELMKSNILESSPWEHDRLLFETILTENLIKRIETNLNFYQTLLPYDPLIMKLFLIILSLSTRISPLFNKIHYETNDFDPFPRDILRSQNYYLTLLWKYVIYRLGYYDAIIYSVRFIQQFLHRQTIEADMMEIIDNRDDHGQLRELLKAANNV